MKLLWIFLFCSGILFAAPTQQELWKEIQKAEEENRVEDAIRMLQEAILLEGPYTEEIEISLQAYAEVLQRPELLPVATTRELPSSSTEWSGYVDVGGYVGQYTQSNDVETYLERYSGANASVNLDWTLSKGALFHTLSMGLGVDDNVPISATGTTSEDSSLASTYTLEPSVGYSLLWDRLLFGVSLDISMPQKDDLSLAGVAFASVALLRHGSLRWTAVGSAYGGPITRDQFSIRTSLSRKINNGIGASLSLAYLAIMDTASQSDSAVLNHSGSGPEVGAKLGWDGDGWRLESFVSYSIFTVFKKDQWDDGAQGTNLTWKKQYVKFKLGLSGVWSLTKALESNLSVSYQLRDYPNMPSSHPEYYLARSTTVGANLGLSYSF